MPLMLPIVLEAQAREVLLGRRDVSGRIDAGESPELALRAADTAHAEHRAGEAVWERALGSENRRPPHAPASVITENAAPLRVPSLFLVGPARAQATWARICRFSRWM